MSGTYARTTDVPVSKSFDEVKRTLTRFGASAFGYGEKATGEIAIQFEIHGLRVMMRMQLPDRSQFELNSYGNRRPDSAVEKDFEQACRQRWRTLANGVKAKLAMVDDGLSTVEHEFLADVMTPDGSTVGEQLVPQLDEIVRSGVMPPLMHGMGRSKVIAIGERTG